MYRPPQQFFLSTSGVQQSTISRVSIRLSSDSTTASKTGVNVDYANSTAQKAAKYEYQAMFYNPSTMPFTCNIYTEEIGLSTGSTQDYELLTSVTVPGSTETGLGRTIKNVHGIFNGADARFQFVNNTCGSSDSTSVLIVMALKGLYEG